MKPHIAFALATIKLKTIIKLVDDLVANDDILSNIVLRHNASPRKLNNRLAAGYTQKESPVSAVEPTHKADARSRLALIHLKRVKESASKLILFLPLILP